jgi:hypothetical protein
MTLENYANVLREMGQTDDEIKVKVDSLGMGLPLSSKVFEEN